MSFTSEEEEEGDLQEDKQLLSASDLLEEKQVQLSTNTAKNEAEISKQSRDSFLKRSRKSEEQKMLYFAQEAQKMRTRLYVQQTKADALFLHKFHLLFITLVSVKKNLLVEQHPLQNFVLSILPQELHFSSELAAICKWFHSEFKYDPTFPVLAVMCSKSFDSCGSLQILAGLQSRRGGRLN